jgi:hypothetical protein
MVRKLTEEAGQLKNGNISLNQETEDLHSLIEEPQDLFSARR